MRDNKYHHYQTQRHPDYPTSQSINPLHFLTHEQTPSSPFPFFTIFFFHVVTRKKHTRAETPKVATLLLFSTSQALYPPNLFLLRFYFISKPPHPPFSLFALSAANAAAAAVFIIMSVLAGLVGRTTPPIGSILQHPTLYTHIFFVTPFFFLLVS